MKEKKNMLRMLEYIIKGIESTKSKGSWTGLDCFVRELQILRAFLSALEWYQYDDILDVFCGKEPEEDAEQM